MKNWKPSRRLFAALAGAGMASWAAEGLTARQVIERIQKQAGVPWRGQTVDTFKAGNPDTQVTGIATTFMATLEMLQRAAKAKTNLVITHERRFYNHLDQTKEMAQDPVVRYKQEFIAKNNLVVWRFHDHSHDRKPDGVDVGFAKAMGWEKYLNKDRTNLFAFPATTLGALAAEIQNRLKIRTLRAIGDPETKVSRVALSLGYSDLGGAMQWMREADVLVVGELREWEGVEYAQDAIAAGEKKGLIVTGHVISEEPGMEECARWLRTFITEVPVEFIPAREPFWRPR